MSIRNLYISNNEIEDIRVWRQRNEETVRALQSLIENNIRDMFRMCWENTEEKVKEEVNWMMDGF